jgi:hypothetical protein
MILRPLRNLDNKDNPNYNQNGPDKRLKIIDFAKCDTTRIWISIQDGQGTAVQNYLYSLQAFARPKSGGHEHTSNRRPPHLIAHSGDTVVASQSSTNQFGKDSLLILASGFAGIDSMHAWGHNTHDTSNLSIAVRFDTLALYSGNAHDTLVGMTTEHPANHYATPEMIGFLNAFADSAFSHSTSWILRINDISLITGGPLDCSPLNYAWDTPHQKHREGTSVDIGATAKDRVTAITEEWLRHILDDYFSNVGYKREGDPVHYHLYLK